MPEFVLNTEGAGAPWHSLDAFTQGFIEAAFFCESSCYDAAKFFTDDAQEAVREGQSDGSIPSDSSVSDIDRDSFCLIKDVCYNFQSQNAALLQEAYSAHWRRAAIAEGWTRNAHNGYFVAPIGHETRMADYDSWQDLCECEGLEPGESYDETQAGRDLYYTRAGHGVGYWDREALEADGLGERLSNAAGRGEINLDAYQDEAAGNGFLISFYIA